MSAAGYSERRRRVLAQDFTAAKNVSPMWALRRLHEAEDDAARRSRSLVGVVVHVRSTEPRRERT